MMAYDARKWQDESRKVAGKRNRWLRWYLLPAALAVLSFPIMVMVGHGGAGDWVPSPGMSMILPLLIGILLSPFGRVYWFLPSRRSYFDEFELAALQRSVNSAYATFIVMVLAWVFWLWLASVCGWPRPATPPDWAAWGFALLGIGVALPVIYAEWMIPFPPSNDHEEEKL